MRHNFPHALHIAARNLESKMNMQTAKISIRSSCAGTVNIATLKIGRKVLYETRAWGSAYNAAEDAKAKAAALGLQIKR